MVSSASWGEVVGCVLRSVCSGSEGLQRGGVVAVSHFCATYCSTSAPTFASTAMPSSSATLLNGPVIVTNFARFAASHLIETGAAGDWGALEAAACSSFQTKY